MVWPFFELPEFHPNRSLVIFFYQLKGQFREDLG